MKDIISKKRTFPRKIPKTATVILYKKCVFTSDQWTGSNIVSKIIRQK